MEGKILLNENLKQIAETLRDSSFLVDANAPLKNFKRTMRKLDIVNTTQSAVSVSSITRSGTTMTVTTATDHLFIVGDSVLISGANETDYNNGWRILTVPSSTTFTCEMATDQTPTTPATGTITATLKAQLVTGSTGDSVAPKVYNQFRAKWAATFEKDIYLQTKSLSGDAWDADGTSGKEYDYEVNFAGTYTSIGSGGEAAYSVNGNNPECDFIVVYYVKESGAGIFKLQESTDEGSPSSWSDITGYTSIDCDNPTTTYGRILLRSDFGSRGIKAVHVSGGRVRITRVIFNALSKNAFVEHSMQRGGMNFEDYLDWDTSTRDAMLADVCPTLWFCENKENVARYETGGFINYLDAVIAAANTEFVLILTSPDSSDTGAETENDTYAENALVRQYAEDRGLYWFDAYRHFKTYSALTDLSWEGDGTHLPDTANDYLSAMMLSELSCLMIGPNRYSFYDIANAEIFTDKLNLGTREKAFTVEYDKVNSVLQFLPNPNTEGNVNAFKFFDINGNERFRISTHDTSIASNPSRPYEWFKFLGDDQDGSYGVKSSGNVLSLQNSYNDVSGRVSGFYRGLSTPKTQVRNADKTTLPGESYISATGTTTYTLPTTAEVGQRHQYISAGGTVTIAQPASVQVVGGADSTTAGTGGSITMAANSALTLEAVTSTLWVVVAGTPGVSNTWA